MKIKAIILTSVFLSFLTPILCQTYQENLEKYWYYRERLKNEFIYYTGDPDIMGSHQPIECRANYENNPSEDYIRMGDAALNLGHYIGMLAIEYRLLRDNGQEYEETLLELYYALQAYDRLDRNAENCFRGPNPPPPLPEDWNGFFLRDDMINDQVRRDYFNVDHINSGYDQCCNISGGNVISQDQALGLFLGLQMAKLLIPSDEYIQERAVEIAHAIIMRMHIVDNVPGTGYECDIWKIINPVTGEEVPLGGSFLELFPQCYAHATSATGITAPNYPIEHRSYSDNYWPVEGFDVCQNHILQLIEGSINLLIPCIIWVPILGIPPTFIGWRGITKEIGPFNSSMIVTNSLLSIDCGDNEDNLYEWFRWIYDNTHELYGMPPDVGIFPHLPLLAKLMWDYNGPELIEASYYKTHFFDTAPACGAHNYIENGGDSTATPWHTLSLFSPWHSHANGSIFDGDYNMMDYMTMYTAYIYDYYNDPKPYYLVTIDYPERSSKIRFKDFASKNAKTSNSANSPYPDIIQAPRRIDAINTLYPYADVWMKAGQEVHLLPGFHAYYGSRLRAYIDPSLDTYPVYFEKTTTDPCGQEKYSKHKLTHENIEMLLEQCRKQKYTAFKDDEDLTMRDSIYNDRLINMENLTEINNVILYPNPSDGMFFVEIHDDNKFQKIEMYNSMGVVVSQSFRPNPNKKIEINIHQYQSGIYYLKIISDDTVELFKLIKK